MQGRFVDLGDLVDHLGDVDHLVQRGRDEARQADDVRAFDLGLGQDLAFNTAISFTTNTNWQWYSGEVALSNFSQMMGLTIHNFLSAASGIAVAFALFRGFARRQASGIGNVWADITRVTLYLLLPICLVYALYLIASGVPQTLAGVIGIDSAGAFVNYVVVGFVWKTVMEVILLPITYPTIAAVRRAEERYVSDPA